MRASSFGLTLALAIVLAGATANAQEPTEGFDHPYVAAKLMLAVAGTGPLPDVTSSASVADDLLPTFGVGVSYMHPVFTFLGFGGQVAVASWTTSSADAAGGARNVYADLSFTPQVNLDAGAVEISGGVLVGPSLDFVGDGGLGAAVSPPIGTRSVEVQPAFGYHFGLLIGARLALDADFGVLIELGLIGHRFRHTVELTQVEDASRNRVISSEHDVNVPLGQVALNAGIYF